MFARFKRPIIWALILFVLVILLVNVFFQTFKAQAIEAVPISNIWQPDTLHDQYWVDAGENQVDILSISHFNQNSQTSKNAPVDENEFVQLSLKLNFGELHTKYQDTYFIQDMINGILNAQIHSEDNLSLKQFIDLNTGSLSVSFEKTQTLLDFEIHNTQINTFIPYLFNALSAVSFSDINLDEATLINSNIESNEAYINEITTFYQQYFHADNLQIIVSSPFKSEMIINKIKESSTALPKTLKKLPALVEPNIFKQLPIVEQKKSSATTQILKVGFKIDTRNLNTRKYLDIIATSLLADLPNSVKSNLNEKVSIKKITPIVEAIDNENSLFALKLTIDQAEKIDSITVLNILMSYFNTLNSNEFEIAYNQIKTHQDIVQSTFLFENSKQWVHFLNEQYQNDLNSILSNLISLQDFDKNAADSLFSQFNADNLYLYIESNQFEKDSTLRLSSRLLSQIRTINNPSFHFSENPFNLDISDISQPDEEARLQDSILFSKKPNKVFEQSVTSQQIGTELWETNSKNIPNVSQIKFRLWANPTQLKNQQALSTLYASYLTTQIKDLIWMAKNRDITLKIQYIENEHAYDLFLTGPSTHSEQAWFALLNQIFQLESSLSYLNESKTTAINALENNIASKNIADQILFNTINVNDLTTQIQSISMNQLTEFQNQLNFNDSIMLINNNETENHNIELLKKSLTTLSVNKKKTLLPNENIESTQEPVSTKNKTQNLDLNNEHYVYKFQSSSQNASIYNRIQLSETSYRAQAFSLIFNQLVAKQIETLINDKQLSELDNSVKVNSFYKNNDTYIDFYLSSNKIDPTLLHLHLKQLLSQPIETIIKLDLEQFDLSKNRISYKLKDTNQSFNSKNKQQWDHILAGHIHFNDQLRISNELQNFSLDSFIRILKTQILADNAKQISIFDLGENSDLIDQYNTNKVHLESITTIQSLDHFRKDQ